MELSKMKSFAKHSSCPTSHEILSYVEGLLRPIVQQKVAQHCAACDFCGAEAQLFAKYQPSEERHVPVPASVLITVLGVTLPAKRPFTVPARRAA